MTQGIEVTRHAGCAQYSLNVVYMHRTNPIANYRIYLQIYVRM